MAFDRPEQIRLEFDRYQRYRMTAEIVGHLRQEAIVPPGARVLDVGGYPGFARAFLPADDVTVVDVVPLDEPWYVQASGARLPFDDASFDVVTSLDTLEHVPPADRARFLGELHRVAAKLVVLSAPFDAPHVRAAEGILFEFIRSALKMEQAQLKEHSEHGLPDLQMAVELLRSAGARVATYPSGYVHNWLKMMLVKHYVLSIPSSGDLAALIDEYYNRHLYARDHRAPSYRQVVVALKGADARALERLDGCWSAATSEDSGSHGEAAAELTFLSHLLSLAVSNRMEWPYAQKLREVEDLRKRVYLLEDELTRIKRGRVLRLLNWLSRATGG